MELGIAALNLPSATVPIPDYNDASPGSAIDPYQMIQLHDYRSVSFIRMDSATKTASRKTIEVMAAYYPELLSAKLFVNVPMVMSWVFTAMKAFLSKETLRKFKVVSSGKSVVNELGEDVPKIYGGKGEELRLVGNGPKLAPDVPTPEKRSADNLPVEKEKEKVAEKEKSLPSTPAVTAAPSSEATAPATPPKEPEGTAAQPSEPTAAISTIPEAKEEEEAATKSETAPPPPPPQKDTVPEAATAPAPAVEATPAPLTEPKEQVVSEIRQEAAPAAEPTPTTTETPAKEETVLNEKLPVAAETEANAEQTPAPAPVAIPATQEVIISEKSEVVVMPESTTTAPATEAAAVMA